MADGEFYPKPAAISLSEIAKLTGAEAAAAAKLDAEISGVAALEDAGPGDIGILASPKYADAAAATRAGACFCSSSNAARLPATTVALIVPDPHRALAVVQQRLYPSALRPLPVATATGIAETAQVSSDARLEEGVTIEAGAVVGPGVEVGTGTLIGPNAVIGRGVKIGRNCAIGAGATVQHAFIGDNVILHPGVHIGQDGFGYIPGEQHLKVPQIGRVIIQDNVEIGAATTIDRGGVRDTVIGEGTKIDNQVQIAHNVTIGRHCLIAAQVGISGSSSLGDYVVIGGQAGIAGHLKIESGAQLGADSAVRRDVPANVKWAGKPARPLRDWLRAQSRALNPPRARGRAEDFSEDSDG